MFRNIICDKKHTKSYGLGVKAVTEVHKRIVNIIVDLIIFLHQRFYDTQNPRKFPYQGKFPYPLFLKVFLHNLIPGLLYPGFFTSWKISLSWKMSLSCQILNTQFYIFV